MKYSPSELIIALLKTSFLLIILEILSTTLFPMMGFLTFRPSFNILIVLFLAFKIDDDFLPYLILVTQLVHSIFSIEGWALGTLSGILIATLVKYLKDLMHFSSGISIMLVVQIFQILHFLIISILLGFKLDRSGDIFSMFFFFLPATVLISLIAPIFFKLLDRIWLINKKRSSGAVI